MLLIPIVARAHAYIIATSPAQGGRVTTPPREVDIQFDEPVTLESRDALVVRDSGGAVIPCAGGAHIDPRDATRLVCSFASRLARGSYTVAWRVTSADTHVVHGVFSFGVEVAAVAPAQGAAPWSASPRSSGRHSSSASSWTSVPSAHRVRARSRSCAAAVPGYAPAAQISRSSPASARSSYRPRRRRGPTPHAPSHSPRRSSSVRSGESRGSYGRAA